MNTQEQVDVPRNRENDYTDEITPEQADISRGAENNYTKIDNPPEQVDIPRNRRENDYTEEMAARRREFICRRTGAHLSHVAKYSFDPSILPGNIENFIGVAQVPIGVAGPLRIKGEHAQGDFYIPLATSEGALVASYNRGMQWINECGGVKATVIEDSMQRAPVWVLPDAVQAREFGRWVERNFPAIKAVAESTTRRGKLINIGQYGVGPLRYLRFNYTTGDAAGQNLSAKATFVACEWIRQNSSFKAKYLLSGNIDTDKKHSQINVLLTRGKRVVAEVILPHDLLKGLTKVESAELFEWRQTQSTGALLVGSANNGSMAANALSALFIATGQDAANVAESQAAITYSQLLANGDYYWSVTLTSLIVASYGGGTGLSTQRECLEMLGCYGEGKANKFAEICGAVVLAGETSLSIAAIQGEWVTAHERLGRNRPVG